ncbi:MAG: hypothetical protein ACLFPS_09160 [Clostridia bacterium]
MNSNSTNRINDKILKQLFYDDYFTQIEDIINAYIKADDSLRDINGNPFPNDYIYDKDKAVSDGLPSYESFRRHLKGIGAKLIKQEQEANKIWMIPDDEKNKATFDSVSAILKEGIVNHFDIKYQICVECASDYFPEMTAFSILRGVDKGEYAFYNKGKFLFILIGNEEIYNTIKDRLNKIKE